MQIKKIKRDVYDRIIIEAEKADPLECCGYLAGNGETITQAYPMKNMDESRIHYSFDPAEQFKTVKAIRNEKLSVMAVYHSHPETPARPSEEDIRLAYDPEVSHVIISLCERENIDVKSYTIKQGQVQAEELIIE